MCSGKVYEKKSFTREEWNDQVMWSMLPTSSSKMFNSNEAVRAAVSGDLSNKKTFHEPAVTILLLNYFVSMAYEEASIRMARELGYVKSNRDAMEFNDLYKISERARISELIKKGNIAQAMESINMNFGIEVLECNGDAHSRINGIGSTDSSSRSSPTSNGKEDLHFKLLLLNLIEMIRTHDREKSKQEMTTERESEDSDEFVLNLIQYAQEKLALKASTNRSYMAEVELVMTLLLFPMDDHSKVKKPKSLKNLYSLSLRSKIADLVNRKLLSHIHPSVEAICSQNNKFPNLIGSGGSITDRHFSKFSEMLKVRPKEDISSSLETEKVADVKDSSEGLLKISESSVSEDWANTADMIKAQQCSQQLLDETSNTNASADDFDLSEYQYEAKLVQVMKLWAWCENQLHNNDIGVPRIGSNT